MIYNFLLSKTVFWRYLKEVNVTTTVYYCFRERIYTEIKTIVGRWREGLEHPFYIINHLHISFFFSNLKKVFPFKKIKKIIPPPSEHIRRYVGEYPSDVEPSSRKFHFFHLKKLKKFSMSREPKSKSFLRHWDLNLEFQMLVALRVITTSEWSRSEL